jgi:hypothetical protein
MIKRIFLLCILFLVVSGCGKRKDILFRQFSIGDNIHEVKEKIENDPVLLCSRSTGMVLMGIKRNDSYETVPVMFLQEKEKGLSAIILMDSGTQNRNYPGMNSEKEVIERIDFFMRLTVSVFGNPKENYASRILAELLSEVISFRKIHHTHTSSRIFL